MLILWLLASFAFIVFYELNSIFISPYIESVFGMSQPTPIKPNYAYDFFILFSQINMEGCVAASIKLGKLWYIKQQEINLITQEKENIKLHEANSDLHPAFLTDLLNRMEIIANKKPAVAAQSMKKIGHLLLYILYENTSSKVPLNKEIALLQEYIELEKLTAEKNIEVNVLIKALPTYETIAPFILLPLVENAFKQLNSYNIHNPLLVVKVLLQNEIIDLDISWNKPIETSSFTNGRNFILQNISKRLDLIYPQSHDIRMTIEPQKIVVLLKINLKKAIN